jgi:hypothetical protein
LTCATGKQQKLLISIRKGQKTRKMNAISAQLVEGRERNKKEIKPTNNSETLITIGLQW